MTPQASSPATPAEEALALCTAAVAGIDATGMLLWANPACLALLERPDGAAGQPLAELLGLDDADRGPLQRALQRGGDAAFQVDVQRRHGSVALGRVLLQGRRSAAGGHVLTLAPVGSPLSLGQEEALAQLTLAVQMSGIAIVRHDLVNDRVQCNAQGWALLDLPPCDEGLPLAEVQALIHPDDLGPMLDSALAALHSDRPHDVETRVRRRDGSWRTLMARRVAQRDADGRAVAFLGVALDVTERLEESRRAVELARRFELATRTAGIGYWSLEGDDLRPRWSEPLRALHGLAPDEPVPTLRRWLARHVHREDRAATHQRLRDWVRSGRRSLEADLRIVRSDGQVRHVVTHSRVESGAPHALLFGLVIDVTDRRNAEAALRQASERAALAARAVGLGTWELDLRDGSAYWDEQMWRLRGLEPGVEPPDAEARMAMVHPEDRSPRMQELARAGQDDAPANYEFRVRLPDGSERWLASRSTPVRDDAGRSVRRIGVNWDITDRRTAEAVRQEREMARRESLAKSQFLARMSHELRTPLNAVLGFAQLLHTEDQGQDAAAQSRRRRLAHILSAGQHLLSLINDVLDLSSLEGGELRIASAPVALAPLVADTLPLLDGLRRTHRVEIVTGALDVVPMADATRLRQVLLNLLTNAVKYNHAGGRVTLDAQRDGAEVVIRVADTGRGLTDAQRLHLFEPFNRLGSERDSIEGTGIGLAIVKALVERMGGSIAVDSQPGQGSVFALRLPDGAAAARRSPTAPPPDTAAAPARGEPRGTLLYIEDNPVNALIIAELIARRPDLRLHVAEDGRSGVAQAAALRPDLVLLDMQLPDIDGHEVLRRLRGDPLTAAIPVIALSANAMPEDIERGLRAGLADYWTKPLDFRAFMASIESLFGRG